MIGHQHDRVAYDKRRRSDYNHRRATEIFSRAIPQREIDYSRYGASGRNPAQRTNPQINYVRGIAQDVGEPTGGEQYYEMNENRFVMPHPNVRHERANGDEKRKCRQG